MRLTVNPYIYIYSTGIREVVGLSPTRYVLFSTSRNFGCFKNNFTGGNGCCCLRWLAFLVLNFTDKTSYITRATIPYHGLQVSYSRSTAIRSLSRGVLGSSPNRDVLFSTSWSFDCFQSNCSQPKMVAVARAWMVLPVLTFTNKTYISITFHCRYTFFALCEGNQPVAHGFPNGHSFGVILLSWPSSRGADDLKRHAWYYTDRFNHIFRVT